MGAVAPEERVVTQKKTQGKHRFGSMGVLGLIIAVVLALGYFMKDCMPNMGIGKKVSSEESSAPPAAKDAAQGEGSAGVKVVPVVVKGESCQVAGDAVAPCLEVCATLMAKEARTTRIEVNSVQGAHGVTEALKACLVEGGFKEVTVRSN